MVSKQAGLDSVREREGSLHVLIFVSEHAVTVGGVGGGLVDKHDLMDANHRAHYVRLDLQSYEGQGHAT